MTTHRWWDEGDSLRSAINWQVLAGASVALVALIAVPGWVGKSVGVAAGVGWALYHLAGQTFDSFSRWARRNDLAIPARAPERLLSLPQVSGGQASDREVVRAAWGTDDNGLHLAYVAVEDGIGKLHHLAVVRCPQAWPYVKVSAHDGDRTHPAWDRMPPLHQRFVSRYDVACQERRAAAALLSDDVVSWLVGADAPVNLTVVDDTAVLSLPPSDEDDDGLHAADTMLAHARTFARKVAVLDGPGRQSGGHPVGQGAHAS